MLGQNIGGVDVDDRAKICKGIESGEFVPIQIVRDRLLRYAELLPEFGLRESALLDRRGEVFCIISKVTILAVYNRWA